MRSRTCLLFALPLVFAAACSPAVEGFVIEGRLLDGNTGEPVTRETVYVHFFCDHVSFKESLEPKNDPKFFVRTPERKVRIRAFDSSGRYELFEEIILIDGNRVEYDILLAPTGYVVLRGKVIEKSTGRPPARGPGIGDTPLFYLATDGDFSVGPLSFEPDGTYSVRVPREVVRITFVNTPLGLKSDTVDLTGVTAEEHVFDIVLE